MFLSDGSVISVSVRLTFRSKLLRNWIFGAFYDTHHILADGRTGGWMSGLTGGKDISLGDENVYFIEKEQLERRSWVNCGGWVGRREDGTTGLEGGRFIPPGRKI